MSNPIKNAECTPEEAFSIVGDNVIFGSGSPFCNFELGEGALEADLNILPKYKFQTSKDEHRVDLAADAMVPIETNSGYMPSERTLSPDDAWNAVYVSVLTRMGPSYTLIDTFSNASPTTFFLPCLYLVK
ncbi:hypothetical protein OROMI_003601 [Orobanche minor]